MRGNTPRLFQNTLVFLAADKTRLQDLDEATRRYLAWESILADKVTLEPRSAAGEAGRDPEDFCRWGGDGAPAGNLPVAAGPGAAHAAIAGDLAGACGSPGRKPWRCRASKKLRNDELLLTSFAATRLRMELDGIPLWRGDHVSVKQLAEDFARYVYLPRLKDSSVLLGAIQDGVSLLTWEREGFALADSYDEAEGRYRGLRYRAGGHPGRRQLDQPAGERRSRPQADRRRTKTCRATSAAAPTSRG